MVMLTPYRRWSRDPFQVMDELMRQNWEGEGLRSLTSDVYETHDAVVVEAAIPGMKPEDISISATGDTLTISGETQKEQTDEKREYHQKEISYGRFSQSVTLPASVEADKAEAHFEHGMLKVILPKKEDVKPKQIQVKVK
jgi:HSP20 family protein